MKTARPSWTTKSTPPVKDVDFDYHGARWRKDADAHKLANPYCAHCTKDGKVKLGRFSDHIISIKNGGHPWDWRNRQNLCDYHDSKKRQEEQRGISPAYIGEWGDRLPVDS